MVVSCRGAGGFGVLLLVRIFLSGGCSAGGGGSFGDFRRIRCGRADPLRLDPGAGIQGTLSGLFALGVDPFSGRDGLFHPGTESGFV